MPPIITQEALPLVSLRANNDASPLRLPANSDSRLGVQSEQLTPTKNEAPSPHQRYPAKPESQTVVVPHEDDIAGSDNMMPVSPDQIDLLIVEKETKKAVLPPEIKAHSADSTEPLDFEEAVNTTE